MGCSTIPGMEVSDGISERDEADLVIDGALFEEREMLFGCPESELDYAYVCALIRCAYLRGAKDALAKSDVGESLRDTFLELGFSL